MASKALRRTKDTENQTKHMANRSNGIEGGMEEIFVHKLIQYPTHPPHFLRFRYDLPAMNGNATANANAKPKRMIPFGFVCVYYCIDWQKLKFFFPR